MEEQAKKVESTAKTPLIDGVFNKHMGTTFKNAFEAVKKIKKNQVDLIN